MNIDALIISIDDVKYKWFGGFGAVFFSYEMGVKPGDVRYIVDEMFYACSVYTKWLRKSEVCWTFARKFDVEDIRKFKKKIFGCEQ
jgi:hypothetical protein